MYRGLVLAFACCLSATMLFVSPVRASRINGAPQLGPEVDLLRVVVLDVSGSMDEADTKGLSRLDTARKEIQEALTQLPADPGTPLVLVPFSDKVWDDSERTYTSTTDLRDALVKIKPKGMTNIAAGLSRAVERIYQLA